MKYFWIFLLICGVCSAQDLKPNIPTDKILDEQEQIEVKQYLKGKIFKELQPTKNDYVNAVDRGTIDFNPKKGMNILGKVVYEASNLSFHKLTIPDGTVLMGINFSQRVPHSQVIQGENLTFIECNLTNVQVHPSWILIDSNNNQVKRILRGEEVLSNGNIKLVISHQVEKDGKFTEVVENEEIISPDDYDRAVLRLNTE